MGTAVQLIAGRVTNPGATVTALTVNSGDSFTVQNFPNSAQAYLDQMWSHSATPGIFRIRSPRMHDSSQGIRQQVGATTPELLLPTGANQQLYPSDSLTVEGSGGGAETDNFYYQVYYTDLPGIAARLATWQEVQPRIVDIAGVEVDLTTSATAGQWSAGAAINASFDTFKANTDYAVLGYTVATVCGSIAIAGPDTGNFRLGGPGALDHVQTRDFFIRMARNTGRPYIPIINSNNKGTTLAYVSDPATATGVNVTFTLAQLSQ
jgi:hypothetical protein